MSTSDPTKGLSLLNPDTVPKGMPDPAVLTRMANEFFRASPPDVAGMPNAGNVGQLPSTTGLTMPAAPTNTAMPTTSSMPAASMPREPTEADLRAIPMNMPDAKVPNAPDATRVMASPGIPGGYSAGDFSTVPSFGFLSDARGLIPAMPLNTVPMPTTGMIEGPGFQMPRVPTTANEVMAPQVPGALPTTVGAEKIITQSFMDGLNPLESFTASPTLEPVKADLKSPSLGLSSSEFDVAAIRRDFPILQEQVNGRQLIWLDNAATTQKPQSVIDRLSYFYTHENSNVHRAAHTLAARSTDAYEGAREKVRRFLNAQSAQEIIFVRGATEGINLVAKSWGQQHIQKDDEIVITWLEHHANIVPWQQLCSTKGAKLRVAPVDNTGQVLLDEYQKLLNNKTKLVALAHVSNALGTVTPVQEMTDMAHRVGAKVLIDGAQAVSHMRVDMQAYDCDFYVLSGHKLFAPTGIGVVFGKSEVLNQTPPWQGGGNMISDVTFEKTTYQPPPGRFEAGTGNIADAIGLGAAIDYLERIGMHNIARYEHDLLVYGMDALQKIPGLHMIGTAKEKASVMSFVLDGHKTEEVGAALARQGIAVRAGHHCAQPILRRFGTETSVRPSLAFYNTCEEIDALVAAIWNIKGGRSPSVI